MKKKIFLSILLLSTKVVSSYGQGLVIFSSYAANGSLGAITTYFGSSTPVGIGFTADLYYALGTVSDPVNSSSFISIISDPTGLTDLGVFAAYDNSGVATGADGLGYFDGPTVIIPGYTSGPITFEVVAFNGSSYADSIFRGRSGSFTMDSIANIPGPATLFGDNGQSMPNFVIPAPEPTTLALAGLGGLASLVAFRRKQA